MQHLINRAITIAVAIVSRCQPAAQEMGLRQRPRKLGLRSASRKPSSGDRPARVRIVQHQKRLAHHVQTMGMRKRVSERAPIFGVRRPCLSPGLLGKAQNPEAQSKETARADP